MADRPLAKLSPRESQIMEALFAIGEGTVTAIQSRMPDAPTYSAVRGTLRILVEKRRVTRRVDGPRYVYRPAVSIAKARRNALRQVVRTYFNDSAEDAALALLTSGDAKIDNVRITRLLDRIEQARREGR